MSADLHPEIARRALSNAYRPALPAPGDTVLCFRGREVLLDPDSLAGGQLGLPRAEDFFRTDGGTADGSAACAGGPAVCAGASLRYLFRACGRNFFLFADWDKEVPEALLSRGFAWRPVYSLLDAADREDAFAAETGHHLWRWYADNRFCGRCGAALIEHGTERAMRCPSCGNVIYPRIMPAVLVGLIDGDRLLMIRYRGRAHSGFVLIAGFCEIGESAEETVVREVMEEVGICAVRIRPYRTLPWGYESDLMLGYFAEAEGGTAVTIEESELTEAAWIPREEIEGTMGTYGLAADMVRCFAEKRVPEYR